MKRQLLGAYVSLALGGAGDAGAVYLNPQGLGQALIYPYYTVRSANGNAFNTLVTIVNHGSTLVGYARPVAKVVRVRFREGRNGRAVADFNLYLSPNDVWAAAIVPTADGAHLLTNDSSCTNPAFNGSPIPGVRELPFSNAQYSGANADGGDAGLDRTREGYVEIIEMANLSGVFATAVTHNAAGTPANCAVVQGVVVTPPSISAPSGGLSGTATLINVASGADFTANAEALDDLVRLPFYRNYNHPGPDWNDGEVTPSSAITANGRHYRLAWSIGVDAVSSVLMRSNILNEYVLDANTRSQTDWVFTFPTRRLHVNSFGAGAPFTVPSQPGSACETISYLFFNREERGAGDSTCVLSSGFPCGIPPQPAMCFSSTVLTLADPRLGVAPLPVFGSINSTFINVTAGFANGWMDMTFTGRNAREVGLQSLPASVSREFRTDETRTGVHAFFGLPVVGFMVRTFVNGTLTCAAGNCQGNYGGLFSHKYLQRATGP